MKHSSDESITSNSAPLYAQVVIDRAQADADLALALAQQAKALRDAKDADEQLGKLKKKLNQ